MRDLRHTRTNAGWRAPALAAGLPSPSRCALPRGFTLLEVMLAGAMSVMILLGAYMVYETGQSTFTRTERRTDIQQNARAALETISRQIRLAGYAVVNNPPALPAVVIGDTNVLVIRGDVRLANLNAPTVDTIFGVQPTANASCPETPLPQVPCLMTHTREAPDSGGMNVYAVGNATLPLAFRISNITFAYFGQDNAPLLPIPLDDVAAGGYATSASPVIISPADATNRNRVQRIRVTITASDTRTFVGPGAPPGQVYTLTEEVQLRNQGLPQPN